MNVNFKMSVWYRMYVPDHLEKTVVAKLKDGSISNSNDLYIFLSENGFETDWQSIPESEEGMIPEENYGLCTIEACSDDDFVTYYTNTTKYK